MDEQERERLKKKGKLMGWFHVNPVGRPPKKKDAPPPAAREEKEDAAPPIPAAATEKKRRPTAYVNWKEESNAKLLKDTVSAVLSGDAKPEGAELIPGATLRRYLKAASDATSEADADDDDDMDKKLAPALGRKQESGLLDEDGRKLLQSIAVARDDANNGMTRKELIDVIMEMSGTGNRKKAENHLDYLIRKKGLPELKRGGRVVKAQKTTTKRSQINMEQQLRWHTAVEDVLSQLKQLNPLEYLPLQEHFIMNLEEEC